MVAKLRRYLDSYAASVEALNSGLEVHLDSALLLRHRGLLLLTHIRLAEAIADLKGELERLVLGEEPTLLATIRVIAESLARYRTIYMGTLRAGVHYHLALDQHLPGDFAQAVSTNRTTLERPVSRHP